MQGADFEREHPGKNPNATPVGSIPTPPTKALNAWQVPLAPALLSASVATNPPSLKATEGQRKDLLVAGVL